MRELSVGSGEFEALAGDILARGNALRFRARGVSMRPFIQDGDVLEVSPFEKVDLQVGNVVLFKDQDHSIFAHRVVQMREKDGQATVQLRGDAFLTPDGWVRSDQVLGTVIAVERDGESTRLDTDRRRLEGRLWQCWFWLYQQCYRILRLVSRIQQLSAERSIS